MASKRARSFASILPSAYAIAFEADATALSARSATFFPFSTRVSELAKYVTRHVQAHTTMRKHGHTHVRPGTISIDTTHGDTTLHRHYHHNPHRPPTPPPPRLRPLPTTRPYTSPAHPSPTHPFTRHAPPNPPINPPHPTRLTHPPEKRRPFFIRHEAKSGKDFCADVVRPIRIPRWSSPVDSKDLEASL